MLDRSTVLIACLAVVSVVLSGCGVVRSVTGTDLDAERFDRAREAKTLELRYTEAVKLAERLQRSNPYEEGDITVQVSEETLNNIAAWYKGRTGWLDGNTSYTVDSIQVTLHYGTAIARVYMQASQEQWDVDLRLGMDCQVRFGMTDTDLEMYFEPYNISPIVESTGFLIGSAQMIENVVKAKLGRISEDFPPLRLPLEINDMLPIDNQTVQVRQTVNMDISFPRRVVDYNIVLSDILVFREGVFVVLDVSGVQVR